MDVSGNQRHLTLNSTPYNFCSSLICPVYDSSGNINGSIDFQDSVDIRGISLPIISQGNTLYYIRKNSCGIYYSGGIPQNDVPAPPEIPYNYVSHNLWYSKVRFEFIMSGPFGPFSPYPGNFSLGWNYFPLVVIRSE